MKSAASLRQAATRADGVMSGNILRATAARSPRLRAVLEFLFGGRLETTRFHELQIRPILGSHRNPIRSEPFLLTKERFGGAKDVPMIPLLRDVVDQALRACSYSMPYLEEHVGRTPISPHGSTALSVVRWGNVDWDYVRDIDFRIFLPPQIGHLSGFKTDLQKRLSSALREDGLSPILLGKDEQGRPQVQLRDLRTGVVHGFHLFLIAMHPGFVRADLHHDGGYSPHYAYFPENSMDEHLEAAAMRWSDVIRRQTEDYTNMFNQLSFNIFGEDTGKAGRMKTPGWYLRKAFKWYATLARMRGLLELEEDLLYQYDNFHRSEEEFSYLARRRYYSWLAPKPLRIEDLQRDLARVDSLMYASVRSPKDALTGSTISGDGFDVTVLEPVPEDFLSAARKLLKKVRMPARVRFADSLAGPAVAPLGDGKPAILVPSEWSLVFTDTYVRQILKCTNEEGKNVAREDAQRAVETLLAFLLQQALLEPPIGRERG